MRRTPHLRLATEGNCSESSLNVVTPVDWVHEPAAIRQKELKVLAGLHQFLHILANLTGISRGYM